MSTGRGDLHRALAILRRAMDDGLDLSGDFAGWTVLQRRSLVHALGRSLAGDHPGGWSRSGRTWSGRPGAGATGRS